jgi:hypothetical protein
VKDWKELSSNLSGIDSSIIILNHGRDIHNGFRPFDTKKHVSSAGLNLDNWKLPANAMEVINSGALQHDPMQLFQDWFGLLNRGIILTPVGSSDSHDVSRYLIGQARTYIKARDGNPGKIDIREATTSFKEGRVMISFGLLPTLMVNNKYGPGDIVSSSKEVSVNVDVAGPGWIKADRVSLYANGKKIREEKIINGNAGGSKWKGQWKLPRQKKDVFLVVIAEGVGSYLPFWPIVKPFQPVTSSWTPYTIGSSGAVWIDGDGDGKMTTAYDYATTLVNRFGSNLKSLFVEISTYDESVAVQVAAILQGKGIDLSKEEVVSKLSKASPSVKEGFRKFTEEWIKAKE